jgi:hypothetical protein
MIGLAAHHGIDGRADLLGIGHVKIAGKTKDQRTVFVPRLQPRCGGPGLFYFSRLSPISAMSCPQVGTAAMLKVMTATVQACAAARNADSELASKR